jgi:hypothetical protein
MEGSDMVLKLQARYPKAAEGISLGKCHHCGSTKQLLGCFQSGVCEIRYCDHCLKTHYHEDLIPKLNELSSWSCPYKLGKCLCAACGVKNLKVYCADRSEDIIQSALDHNAFLMMHINNNRNTISKQDHELCIKIVYENLKKLAKLADYHKKEEKPV